MIRGLLFSLVLLSACTPLQRVSRLPIALNESSGLLIEGRQFWLHNDSGDMPYLYLLDQKGQLLRKVWISGAKNIDWEDICRDEKGHIYLADTGNNRNDRKDLCIYKLPAPLALDSDTVTAEKIAFYYPSQKQFPAHPQNRHFDVEAMVALGDSLYLFSKNRCKPNTGWVRMYRLPQAAGQHAAVLQDSFRIPRGHFLKSVTAAALSPSGKTLALLSMGRLRLFSDFQGSHFFQAQQIRKKRLWLTQKEAIDFADEQLLYLSDEKSPLGKASLYRLRLKK